MRIGPVPAYQPAVPVEDGLGRDQERTPPLTRDKTGQQGDERPVRPAEAGPADLAAQHRQLVAQDEDLGVLRDGAHPVDTDELEEAAQEPVEER